MILEFENGVTATFSLTAQTNAVHRNIHIMCENGEIEADDGQRQILVTKFTASPAETFSTRAMHIRTGSGGHGGGDGGIMEDFSRSLRERKTESRSSITRSVESHLMACALEQSRLTGKTVDMAQFRKSLKES